MLFNSYTFAIFLPVVWVVYLCLGRRWQNVWLLLASLVFYGWWDWRFLGLLAVSTVVDFYCGKYIADSHDCNKRWLVLTCSVLTNLSILGFFKYFNFFVGSAADLLSMLGMRADLPTLNIILPVGISFYTFQTMSYTIDIYRGVGRPCRDFTTFFLFVSFFPQLVAGPIERATSLLPQLEKKRTVTGRLLREGLLLIVLGYFKKVGVSDAIAPLIDVRFSYPDQATSSDLLLAVYLFAVQIYCDFSGYTDIARGVSLLLGIRLMINFEQPYFSTSIVKFWRRWHISLSTWLRDYLYIPLGGSHGSTRKTYRNLALTMLLGGLWHGASWNFVIWGGLHGMYLMVHRFFVGQDVRTITVEQQPMCLLEWGKALFKGVLVFNLVCLTWIFFRSPTISDSWRYLVGIFAFRTEGEIDELSWTSGRLFILIGTIFAIDVVQRIGGEQTIFLRLPWLLEAVFMAVLILIILAFGGINEKIPFIYFQF